jgi:hypothetical protein
MRTWHVGEHDAELDEHGEQDPRVRRQLVRPLPKVTHYLL